MTPELRSSVASRARALQHRLNAFDVGAVVAATEAKRIFEGAADDVRCRWLTLELNGYAEHVHAAPLHQVLRVPPGDRLAAHVTAYRTQRGIDATPGHPPAEFRHFFVEPLGALDMARAKIAASASASALLLDFGPHRRDPSYPTSAEFTRGVFDRVLAGFMAALHLQLESLGP